MQLLSESLNIPEDARVLLDEYAEISFSQMLTCGDFFSAFVLAKWIRASLEADVIQPESREKYEAERMEALELAASVIPDLPASIQEAGRQALDAEMHGC